jgi:DNA repair protein RadC
LEIPIYKVLMVQEGTIKYQTDNVFHPRDVTAIFREHVGPVDREYFVVMFLNTKNKLCGINTVSIGNLNSSLVHPREVYTPAILHKANSIVVAHNHPSGDPKPSEQDKLVTSQLVLAGEAIGIRVLDHVVIGDSWVSFRESGLI